jgi:hypothetical protein
MNNGDIINDDVILSLEDGRDLMKKMLRKLCQRGRWRDGGKSTSLLLTMFLPHKMLVQHSHLLSS